MFNQERFYDEYLIPDEIKKNVAIDLGSNIGLFIKDNHLKFNRLYAIEASYENFLQSLKTTAALNTNNVFCFNLAAAKNDSEIIKVYANDNNGNSVSCMTSKKMFEERPRFHDKSWNEENETYHNVFSISLEGLYKFFNIDFIDYLKIDIEGAEYDFLLDKDLSNIGCLAIEIHGTLGHEMKEKLKAQIDQFFNIYHVEYDDPAPAHSVITYLNKKSRTRT